MLNTPHHTILSSRKVDLIDIETCTNCCVSELKFADSTKIGPINACTWVLITSNLLIYFHHNTPLGLLYSVETSVTYYSRVTPNKQVLNDNYCLKLHSMSLMFQIQTGWPIRYAGGNTVLITNFSTVVLRPMGVVHLTLGSNRGVGRQSSYQYCVLLSAGSGANCAWHLGLS